MLRCCRSNICCLQKPSTQQAWHILVHLVSGGCCSPLLSTPASSASSLLGKLISVYNFPVAAPSFNFRVLLLQACRHPRKESPPIKRCWWTSSLPPSCGRTRWQG